MDLKGKTFTKIWESLEKEERTFLKERIRSLCRISDAAIYRRINSGKFPISETDRVTIAVKYLAPLVEADPNDIHEEILFPEYAERLKDFGVSILNKVL